MHRIGIPSRFTPLSKRSLLRLLLDPLPQRVIDFRKHLISPLSRILLGSTKMPSYISNEVILLTRLLAKNFPESLGLEVILIRDFRAEVDCCAGPFLVIICGLDMLVRQATVRGWVVGV